ncbi:MAG: hypothetical protein LBR44_12620 [Clostridiales Family XIII bacterium]|jgi:hypothetical protein|nr:hypothetical protein [Clostridiales Family XIII bacterium]
MRRLAVFLSIILLAGAVLAAVPGGGAFAAAAPPVKTARVLPHGLPDAGSAESPVPVDIGDEIEYTIRFECEDAASGPARFDMLFVLDWSASMNAGYGTDIFSQSEKSRLLAKQAIFSTSRHLLQQYPDSRVAVMGLNSASSNSGDPALSNLQVDTEFADAGSYVRLIEDAFKTTQIDFNNDDNAMFLRMARDKLSGDTSQAYGGAGGVRLKHVRPRVDRSRTPIIVHISDFEIADPPHPSGNVNGFWRDDDPSYTGSQKAASLNAQVRAFREDYPGGVYLAVRVDHFRHYDGSDNRFASPHWNALMEDTIAIGGANWGWRIIDKDNFRSQGDMLKDLICGAADHPLHHAEIIDTLPEGLEYVSADPPPSGVWDSDGRQIVYWLLADFPAGVHEVHVVARVRDEGTYMNRATVGVDGAAPVWTGETWHRAESARPPDPPDPPDPPAVVTARKDAKVLPSGGGEGSTAPGTAEAPVPVKVGDEIEYTITVNSARPQRPAQYDVLFVLDWSRSMTHPYGDLAFAPDGGPYAGLVESYPETGLAARVAAKDTLLALSRRVMDTYPGSRVAVMGLNTYTKQGSIYTNEGRDDLVNLQVDTPFVGKEGYEQAIENAFTREPDYEGDDNATFLKAAIDKLQGAPTVYGGYASVPAKSPVPRENADGRIPVIVHISDFEMLELAEARPDLHAPVPHYWSAAAAPQAERYAAMDGAVYIAVRTIHTFHKVSALSVAYQYGLVTREEVAAGKEAGTAKAEQLVYGDPLEQYVLGKSASFHGLVFDERQSPEQQTEALWAFLRQQMPLATAAAVEDVLPDGLEYVSSDPAAVVEPPGTVRWAIVDLPEGDTVLKVKARVRESGVFRNQARVTVSDGGGGARAVDTNETWHRADERTYRLHLRQVVTARGNNPVELPAAGYALLRFGDGSSGGVASAVIVPSGTSAPPFAPFALAFPGAGRTLEAADVVPQYYEYVGYVRTAEDPGAPGGPAHTPAAIEAGTPSLDYSKNGEYWVTLYIRPRLLTPAPYAWETARNIAGP